MKYTICVLSVLFSIQSFALSSEKLEKCVEASPLLSSLLSEVVEGENGEENMSKILNQKTCVKALQVTADLFKTKMDNYVNELPDATAYNGTFLGINGN